MSSILDHCAEQEALTAGRNVIIPRNATRADLDAMQREAIRQLDEAIARLQEQMWALEYLGWRGNLRNRNVLLELAQLDVVCIAQKNLDRINKKLAKKRMGK